MAYTAGNLDVAIQVVSKEAIDSLDAVIARLNGIKTALPAISSSANKIAKGGNSNGGGDKAISNFNLGFVYGKIRTIFMGIKQIARFTSQILQNGVDYTETLNLWQVAMGDNLDMAREFVSEMNKAYGISEKTLMNAQAIFKNMIGSLGQISDSMAYTLSEAITKMAIDYASLYNVSIDSAITKFQAALAGQVRPIRSVSGYDITENTLYQLYQSIGGTKTMRQLSRTEKQLLSIYAIFQQMGASGALGDMEKTIDQVANQSRMMTENWQQVTTWAGVSLQYLLQQSGIFKFINASLIFLSETLKALAFSLGYEEPDFANSWADNVAETNEEMDKLQGKLLDFDEFRSLSGTEENAIGLDNKLLEAITNYNNEMGDAISGARELADSWLEFFGIVDEDGDGISDITDRAEKFGEVLKIVGIFLGVVFGVGTFNSISKFIKGFTGITSAAGLLKVVLITGVIYAIIKAVEAFKDGNIWGGILATTIGVVLAGAFIYLHRQAILKAWQGLGKFLVKAIMVNTFARGSLLKGILGLSMGFIGLGSAIVGAFALIKNWSDMNTWQRIIGIIGVATTAILGLAMAFGAFHSAWSLGLASAGIVAGIAMIVGSIASVKKDIAVPIDNYANGGLPDKGTLFRAGEAGAEIVYNTPSGQSGVVNVQQIQQAMYGALVQYGRTQGANGQAIEVYLDGEKVYQNTTAHAKRRGNVWGRA